MLLATRRAVRCPYLFSCHHDNPLTTLFPGWTTQTNGLAATGKIPVGTEFQPVDATLCSNVGLEVERNETTEKAVVNSQDRPIFGNVVRGGHDAIRTCSLQRNVSSVHRVVGERGGIAAACAHPQQSVLAAFSEREEISRGPQWQNCPMNENARRLGRGCSRCQP